jgi:hypothetical protein
MGYSLVDLEIESKLTFSRSRRTRNLVPTSLQLEEGPGELLNYKSYLATLPCQDCTFSPYGHELRSQGIDITLSICSHLHNEKETSPTFILSCRRTSLCISSIIVLEGRLLCFWLSWRGASHCPATYAYTYCEAQGRGPSLHLNIGSIFAALIVSSEIFLRFCYPKLLSRVENFQALFLLKGMHLENTMAYFFLA